MANGEKSWEFYVAGVQHHDLKLVIDELIEENVAIELQLKPEPTNKYDKNAIKIMFNSKMLGYVPARLSAQVLAFIAVAECPVCETIKVTPEAKPWNQLLVKIYDEKVTEDV